MMVFVGETYFTVDVQKEDNSASIVGRNFLVPEAQAPAAGETPAAAIPAAYPNLLVLKQNLAASRHSSPLLARIGTALRIEQVEMLEAELINQGILLNLRSQGYTLSRQIAHEESVWRWRALRFGVEGNVLGFHVWLPAYLVERAQELAAAVPLGQEVSPLPGSAVPRAEGGLPAAVELQYLERFSAYLNGEFDAASNRYQRGLNVVLRAISAPAKEDTGAEKSPVLDLTLPLTMKAFVHTLKQFKQTPTP